MKARFGIPSCCLLLLTLLSSALKAQLKADFAASPTGGCVPLVVQFTDRSTGSPTQRKWDLGNGTISFLPNPSVSYFTPGQYTIKLVISDGVNSDSIVKTQFIIVSAKPVIAFSASSTTGCFPLAVQFKDESLPGSGTIASWKWDFGDGFASTVQNPLHTYTSSGNFNVTLRVFNSNGCFETFSKAAFIKINAGVIADFSNSVANVCSLPVTIDFKNLSTGTSALTYDWSFGDGTGSSLINPSHTYGTAGSYTVQLVVTNATGCKDTIIKSKSITVGSVSASFKVPSVVCAGDSFAFINTSSPAPLSASWSFGDSTFSTQLNPVKKYKTPGTYQVKMAVNFGSCTDSVNKLVTILPRPVAAFTADDSTSCLQPFTVNFTNQSLNAASYQWSFGDNTTSALPDPIHTYTSYGSFNVQLVITNSNGCTDTLRKTGYIKVIAPVVKFNNLGDSGCAPFTKTFVSTTTSFEPVTGYLWNFGDGNTSTDAIPTHTYSNIGVYPITLIVTAAGGCTDTNTINRGIVVTNKPVAGFSATPRDVCARSTVNFTDTSSGNPVKWLWDFGDGSTSSLQNPGHTFNDTGYLDIQLIVWNSGCPDTINYKEYIHIKPPIASYLVAFDCNKPYERTFINQSIGADEWEWDFGDGNTSTQKDPVHTYIATGPFVVTLVVRNNTTGCDYTSIKTIQIVDVNPMFFASDTVVCKGSKITFTTSLSLSDVKSFNWNFGEGTPVDLTTNSATYTYKKSGYYDVRLITTDILGCRDSLTKPMYIRVNGPTAKFTPSVAGSCLNYTISFNDVSVSDGIHPIQTWKWNYADGITETLTAPPFQHTYTKPGIYKVSLTVTDDQGCADSFAVPAALVISKPVAAFKTADTSTCPGKPVRFTNQSTGPNLTYAWNFGDGTTSAVQNPGHAYNTDGVYTVKLQITDQYGCSDSLQKTDYVTITTTTARFDMSDSFSTCPPLIVQFTNFSTNAVTQVWNFGDGSSAIVKNPSHFYSYPGTYVISLAIKGRGGCVDTLRKNIVINGPTGTFKYNPIIGCNPVTVNFSATTKDRISFIWDFNNGATLATEDSVISYTYKNQGSYIPKMILIDPNGCQVPVTGKDTIVVSGVISNFKFSDKPVCDAGTVAFTDSSVSNDVITSYQWFFGDGNSASVKDPSHAYTSTGLYYSKLIVTTKNGCVDSVASPKPVKVVASPNIDMSKSANGCAPLTVKFNGLVRVQDTSAISWNWTFGNGNTSLLKDPLPQNYTFGGVYNVNLTVTNSSGCKDTVLNTVDAYLIPSVNSGPDTVICKNVGVVLQSTGADSYSWSPDKGLSCINCASPTATPDSMTRYIVKGTTTKGCSANDTVIVKVNYPFALKFSKGDTLCKGQDSKLFATGPDRFEWSPSTGLNNSTIATPIAQPDTTTIYRIIGTDFKGCFKDTGYVPIKVYPIPTVDAGPDKTINIGKTLDLIPVISSDVTSVAWSPTGAIFRNNYPAISVKPNGTTDYTVEVKNRGGCMNRDVVTVVVICNGSNVFIPNTFSPNGDGANDLFYPRGTGLFKINTLRIFNRWGEIVFERNSFNANDISAAWDGTFKGAKLPADVFVYMIDILCDNGSVLTYKGNVALVQ